MGPGQRELGLATLQRIPHFRSGSFSIDSTSFACQPHFRFASDTDLSLALNQHLLLAAIGEAAVDGDDRAARIRGKIGRQEDDHGGDLVGGRRPAEGHLGEGFPPPVFIAVERGGALAAERLDAVGLHRSGVDADHAHAEFRAGAADGAGERHEAGIAGGAGDIAEVEPLAAGADDVDDHAPAPRLHLLQIEPGEADIAEDLEIPADPPGRLVDVVDRATGDGAGIVDQNVDVRKRRGDTLARRPIGEIRGQRTHIDAGRLAERSGLFFQAVPRAGHEVHMHALARQPLRNRKADPLRAAGDERGASGKFQIHFCSLFFVGGEMPMALEHISSGLARLLHPLVPAKAATQRIYRCLGALIWIPAYAGMSGKVNHSIGAR